MRIARFLVIPTVLLSVVTFSVATAATTDIKLLERGKYLMNSIVACGNCHIARGEQGQPLLDRGLSGGTVFDEEPFKAYAPNITPDMETGIGKWSDAQLVKAIREGIRPDGSIIGPPMPIAFYRDMADGDVKAIVAYLRAQSAVKNTVPKSEYRIKLPPNYGPPIKGPVTAPVLKDTLRYGAYLAGALGHCLDCHTPRDNGIPDMSRVGAGGNSFKGLWGVTVSRNLTPHDSGLKSWSDAEIARAIREGVRRDGSPLKPPMAYGWYKNINEADMRALTAFLRSLKPLPLGGK